MIRDSTAVQPHEEGELVPVLQEAPPIRHAPLSCEQERFWFVEQLGGDPAIYNLSAAWRLRGRLHVEALERALNEIRRRHAVLRTTFSTHAGEPIQIIRPFEPAALPLTTIDDEEDRDRDEQLRRILEQEIRRPFDLEEGPLVRWLVVHLATDHHVLLQVAHHSIFDGGSYEILLRELEVLYAACRSGSASPLPPQTFQYRAYAQRQRQWLESDAVEPQIAYWRKRLAGDIPALWLPLDRARPPVQQLRGAGVRERLSRAERESVLRLASSAGATPYMVHLAALQALLGRYGGQDDIVVATAVSVRSRQELKALIGCLINSVLLRTDLSGDPSFRELVRRVARVAIAAYAHRELPFERLVQALQIERSLGHTPFFRVLFTPTEPPELPDLPGLETEWIELERGSTFTDLDLLVTDSGDRVDLELRYDVDLFNTSTAARILRHYGTLLRGALEDPERAVSRLPILGADERRRVVVEWNDSGRGYGVGALLHDEISAQARRSPQATAIVYDGGEGDGVSSLTYAQLEAWAGSIARTLRKHGVGPDSPVAICAERSPALMAGLLGILRAGGAYLPLDPDHPPARLHLMLEDARPPVVLVQPGLEDRITSSPEGTSRVLLGPITGDGAGAGIADGPRTDRADSADTAPGTDSSAQAAVTDRNLAYVLYTSGSTGQPKGVMVEHRAIVNRLRWAQDTFHLGPDDVVLQKTPLTFDVSVWELFWPLRVGARLLLARPAGQKDPAYLADLIQREGVTILHFVPSMLRPFLDLDDLEARCRSVRYVLASGEALPYALTRRFYERMPASATVHNLYGPTEAAVDVSHWPVPRRAADEVVPIGRPVANTQLYVLDAHFEPLPLGVPGELWIGGVQLARGYLNRPDLTRERFCSDPFARDDAAARLYRTGDRARWLPDGTIEYLGRLDRQVKLRGQRIELGEVEAALLRQPAVAEAAALVRDDANGVPTQRTLRGVGDTEPRLIAYVVGREGSVPDVGELRRALAAELPDVMVPAVFVVLKAMPLTSSGKLDYRQLPPPPSERRELEPDYLAPRNPLEHRLERLWAEVLGLDRVGVRDDFFALGGHSLLAIRLLSRLRDETGTALPLRRIFEEPTIEALARAIRHTREELVL